MLLEKVIFSHMDFFLSIYFWDFWGAIFLPKRCQIVAVKLLHQMENTLLYTICVFIKMQCNNITPAEGKFAMRTNLSLTLKDHHVFRSFQCLKNACFFWLWRSAPTPKHVYIYIYINILSHFWHHKKSNGYKQASTIPQKETQKIPNFEMHLGNLFWLNYLSFSPPGFSWRDKGRGKTDPP